MRALFDVWKIGALGATLALLIMVGWAMRLEHVRAGWEAKYTVLDAQAQVVTLATRQASGNAQLAWGAVPEQIAALGSANIALKLSVDTNNSRVEKMSSETLRMKAAGDLLRANLIEVQKGRLAAIAKLDGLASIPGARGNCPALISQTQDALDITWGSGL